MAVTRCAGPGCEALIASPRGFCHEDWMSLTFSMRVELNALGSVYGDPDAYQRELDEAVAYLARLRATRLSV